MKITVINLLLILFVITPAYSQKKPFTIETLLQS